MAYSKGRRGFVTSALLLDDTLGYVGRETVVLRLVSYLDETAMNVAQELGDKDSFRNSFRPVPVQSTCRLDCAFDTSDLRECRLMDSSTTGITIASPMPGLFGRTLRSFGTTSRRLGRVDNLMLIFEPITFLWITAEAHS